MSEQKTDGVTIREGDVTFQFTFDQFDCIVDAITDKMGASRNGVREAILYGKIPLSDMLNYIDDCTLEIYKQKRIEKLMQQEKERMQQEKEKIRE